LNVEKKHLRDALYVQKEINEVLGFKTIEVRTTDTNKADLSKYKYSQLFLLKHGRLPNKEELEGIGEIEEISSQIDAEGE